MDNSTSQLQPDRLNELFEDERFTTILINRHSIGYTFIQALYDPTINPKIVLKDARGTERKERDEDNTYGFLIIKKKDRVLFHNSMLWYFQNYEDVFGEKWTMWGGKCPPGEQQVEILLRLREIEYELDKSEPNMMVVGVIRDRLSSLLQCARIPK